mgnify:CR=1 FL=1
MRIAAALALMLLAILAATPSHSVDVLSEQRLPHTALAL